jgi:hypothetical protein
MLTKATSEGPHMKFESIGAKVSVGGALSFAFAATAAAAGLWVYTRY